MTEEPLALRGVSQALTCHSSSFEMLPGEIRNQIFELCIELALKPVKTTRRASQPAVPSTQLSILPQWHGPVRVYMSGLGPMGLLFVNKRIHDQLSSLVYSRIGNFRIGGYILQHPDDPMLRWELIYPLLMNPYIFRYMKSISVKLPSTRDDVQRRYCSMRGFNVTGFKENKTPPRCEAIMSVVPGLVRSFQKFEALVDLEITITVEMTSPPNFDPLLPLYDLCGKRTTVVFVDPTIGINFQHSWRQWTERWDIAWKDCLIQNGRKRDCNYD